MGTKRGFECFECGKRAEHAHHVVPEVLGGTRTIPLCVGCHGKVHNKNFLNWRSLQQAGIDKIRAANGGKCTWGGSKPGRRVKVTPEVAATVKRLRADGMAIAAICRVVQLSRPTVYSILEEAR